MNIKVNDKFVCCWGYDQTQYSVYNVDRVKGKYVFVEGLNGWSHLSDHDLAEGSKVKIYNYELWNDLNESEQKDYEKRGFDCSIFEKYSRDLNKDRAEVRTIVKMNRIDGENWTYIWTLDNGQIVKSNELYNNRQGIEIVKGLKKCLVKEGYNGQAQIKIDDVIRASHDPEYNNNEKKYAEQNEYTAYNGR